MQDLSKLLDGFPGVSGGESMAATNTVSKPGPFQPEGSESGSTARIAADTPGPVIPAGQDANTLINFDVHENPADPYHLDAAVPGGGPWTVAPNEDTPGRGGTGPWKNPTG